MAKKPRNPSRELPWGAGDIRARGAGYQARWIDPDGTRHSRQFATADEANDFLRERWRNRRDGRHVTAANLTVADLVRDWLDRGRDDWRPTTYATNRRYADNHAIPAVGSIRADQLDTMQAQRWVDRMRREGVSAHVIANSTRVVSSAYRQAMQLGIVAANPIANTKRPPIRKPDIATWTASDIARVDAALADDPMWQALYRVALTTGMRPGELRALRWDDVDFDAGRIAIRRTITRDADDRIIVGSTTKTGRERIVTLSPAAAESLKRWRTDQRLVRMAARRWDRAGYVFTGNDGGPAGQTTWQRRHAALIAQTGVPRITAHGLRHTFATLALERGTHIKIVQEILGHQSVETTLNRYAHPSSDLRDAAANALDAALFGPNGTANGTDAR